MNHFNVISHYSLVNPLHVCVYMCACVYAFWKDFTLQLHTLCFREEINQPQKEIRDPKPRRNPSLKIPEYFQTEKMREWRKNPPPSLQLCGILPAPFTPIGRAHREPVQTIQILLGVISVCQRKPCISIGCLQKLPPEPGSVILKQTAPTIA